MVTGSAASPSFRLAYVPGVTPGKWVRIWQERLPGVPLELVAVPAAEASDVLRAGDADAALVRLPVDRTVFSAIPLYEETTVVVAPKDHLVTAVDELSAEDLADEILLHPWTTSSAGSGPRAARPGTPRHDRGRRRTRGGGHRSPGRPPVRGPSAPPQGPHLPHPRGRPQSGVALAWPEDATTDLVEDFIGIVRGRTANSTRGRTKPEPEARPERKRAEQKGGGRKPAAGKPTGKGSRGGSGGARGAGGSQGARRGKPRRRS